MELKKFDSTLGNKLRIAVRSCGNDAKRPSRQMYDYDRSAIQFASRTSYQNRTQEMVAPLLRMKALSEEACSPLMNYAIRMPITVTDTYHETKSRFAWIGEIENEQLLTALETLKTEDLEIITMYAYEGYDITEISKVYGVSRPTISIKIKRITKFLKNFNFNATN